MESGIPSPPGDLGLIGASGQGTHRAASWGRAFAPPHHALTPLRPDAFSRGPDPRRAIVEGPDTQPEPRRNSDHPAEVPALNCCIPTDCRILVVRRRIPAN